MPGLPQSDIRARPSGTGVYPNPVHSANVLGKLDHQVSGPDQLTVRYSLYHVDVRQLARRRGAECAERIRGLDNIDHRSRSATRWTVSSRDGQRNARAVRIRRLEGASDRPDRPGGEHRRRRNVRHALDQSDATPQQDVPVRRQSVASGWCARAASRRRFRLQRRHHHVSPLGPRQLYVFDARQLPHRHLQAATRRRSAIRWCRRRARASGCTRRTSGRSARSLTLNLGLRYDLQFLEIDQHRHQQRLAPSRLRLVALGSSDLVVRGSAGLFFDRVPLRPVANASCRPATPPTGQPASAQCGRPYPDTGRRAGVSRTSSPRDCSPRRWSISRPWTRSAERVLEAGEPRGGTRSSGVGAPSAWAISTCVART